MNGYVERAGQKYLWIGKRSEVKPTYPGMLDHLVAGGLVSSRTRTPRIIGTLCLTLCAYKSQYYVMAPTINCLVTFHSDVCIYLSLSVANCYS